MFPIWQRFNPAEEEKDIMWARKRYNKKLKQLANEHGIDHNLISYVCRHSFATQAIMQQVPLNAISAILGHSNINTTEIYLKSLPSSVWDEYDNKLLSNF